MTEIDSEQFKQLGQSYLRLCDRIGEGGAKVFSGMTRKELVFQAELLIKLTETITRQMIDNRDQDDMKMWEAQIAMIMSLTTLANHVVLDAGELLKSA